MWRASQGFIINKSYQSKSYYFDQLVDEKLQIPSQEHGEGIYGASVMSNSAWVWITAPGMAADSKFFMSAVKLNKVCFMSYSADYLFAK